MADETSLDYRINIATQETIASIKKVQEELKRVKAEAKSLQKETQAPFDIIVDEVHKMDVGLGKAASSTKAYTGATKELNKELQQQVAVMNTLKNITTAGGRVEQQATVSFLNTMKGINTTAAQAKQEVGGLGTVFDRIKEKLGELGQVGQFVFGTVLGIGAVEALRKVIAFLKEAITASLDFQKSLFTFEVSVRALQRIGLDTSIKGWTKYLVDLKKQFPIFSEKEFLDAASLAALMTREFGFTEEQMQNVVKQSIILAQVTGRDLTESVRGVTYAIGSGYFESLQRAGINISRQIIANEALARGYEGSYTALSQNVRAMITYEIIQKNLNAIQEDADKIMDTTVGQARHLHAAYQDLLKDLGLLITDTDTAKESLKGLALALEALTQIIRLGGGAEVGGKKLSILELIFGPTAKSIMDALPAWTKALEEWVAVVKTALDIRDAGKGGGLGEFKYTEGSVGGTTTFGDLKLTQEEVERYTDILEEAEKKFAEIIEEGAEKELEIKEKYWADLENNYAKHMQKMEDIQADYDQKIADIGLKESRAAADEEIDYAYKVAEAARQASFRKEEAERRYREREISAEKRFQEKMRQLRENFLLNLEDAVRERDALQIIRLTRQYNLRKTQMEREEGLSGEERANAHQEQLRQIEQQRLERQRQLAIEHQRRLQDIAVQAERERAKAQLDFLRRQEDEKARALAEDTARDEKFNQDMLDLQTEIDARNQMVFDGLREQYKLTAKELENIGKLWDAYYGPGSQIDSSITYAIQRLAQLELMYARVRAMIGQVNIGSGWSGLPPAPGQAEGGTVIANKPTTVTFGEAGLEAATFTPLNRAGVNTNQVSGSLPAGMGGGGGGGKYVVGISLSPGLEGKIVGQALDQAADIIFKLERART